MHFNVNQACSKQEAGQSGEHRALCPACFWNLPAASRLRHLCASCSSELCLLCTAQTSLTSISTLSEFRPLQMSQSQPKTPPKTHSSSSYSNTSGIRGRSCRDNVPSQQCTCQMSFHQPTVSLHSVTREHPGRARSAQRGGILLRACPANSITWILQKQLYFASTRKFTAVAEVLLAAAVMNWVPAMCAAGTVPVWSQLWLCFVWTPLTPKQSPFPLGSCSWYQSYFKKNNNLSSKKTKPTNQTSVGTLCG